MRTLVECGLALVAATAFAQTGNSIEGTVLNDRTGQPLQRSHVLLLPAKAGMSAIGVDTDVKGAFVIRDVEAGRYSLSASRDGYLATSICLMGTVRLPQVFSIGAKESITNLTFRLRPFAVVAGRISFEDGEPAMNVRVDAFREHRNHLRHGYMLAGGATTNDRGEYRMFGMQPGSYLIAATMLRAGPVDEQSRETQALRYATTFYTNTTKLSEAVPVRLDYGQEIGGIDVSLERVRKVHVHGKVISGVTGQPVTATIALQSVDAHNTASAAVNVAATFDANNRFELRNVTPGPYIIWAEGGGDGKALVGSAPLTVAESDVENVELTIEGERAGSAVLVVEGGVKIQESVHLRFEPRNERGKVVDASETAGVDGFHFALMGNDVYDLFVTNLPNDFYASAVQVNGVDAMPFGINGMAASAEHPFEVVLSSRGGRVSGRVLGADDMLWSRASVALIPDPPKGRVQSYQEGSADENGLFLMRGVAPGKYILVAWLDDPPCDYYDPDGLASCRATGMSVEVQEAGEQNVELKMKALAKQ
ncbi:MAG: carboxypeptidase regulatory-like domain-containing protein [Bryobacteraceae bacterium]